MENGPRNDDQQPLECGQSPSKRRGSRRRWITVMLALLASPLAAELGLRWMLFGESALARRMGTSLRRASLFAPTYTDDHWKLQKLFTADLERRFKVVGALDPTVGWVNGHLTKGIHDTVYGDQLNGRRPVVLLGASNLRPIQAKKLRESSLSSKFAMLPYGVGGFGVDQMALLLEQVAPQLLEPGAVVLAGVTLNGDLERVLLSFREMSKPRFELDVDQTPRSVPFETLTIEAYLDAHPPQISSYLLASANSYYGWFPGATERANARRAEALTRAVTLNVALLDRMRDTAESHGATFAVLAIQGLPLVRERKRGAVERAFLAGLEDEGICYVEMRPLLERAATDFGGSLADAYIPQGEYGAGHFNAHGEEAIFQLICRALAGDFDHSTRSDSPYDADTE